MKVFSVDNFDTGNLKYHTPKLNAFGSQSVHISYEDDNKLVFQTPKCKVPYGLSEYNAPGATKKHSIELVFDLKSS